MENYQVTIGYRAVYDVSVKADSEDEAKEKALEMFDKKVRTHQRNISLSSDNVAVSGDVNMDTSWNLLD